MGKIIINKFVFKSRIMGYLKYLLKNKSKLLFHLFTTIFSSLIMTYLIIDIDYVISESSVITFTILIIFLLLILCVGNYQPYKEWKDGINRKS